MIAQAALSPTWSVQAKITAPDGSTVVYCVTSEDVRDLGLSPSSVAESMRSTALQHGLQSEILITYLYEG